MERKHYKNFPNVLGGYLIFVNITLRKEEEFYAILSSRVTHKLCLLAGVTSLQSYYGMGIRTIPLPMPHDYMCFRFRILFPLMLYNGQTPRVRAISQNAGQTLADPRPFILGLSHLEIKCGCMNSLVFIH
jgi:hypothetical protein